MVKYTLRRMLCKPVNAPSKWYILIMRKALPITLLAVGLLAVLAVSCYTINPAHPADARGLSRLVSWPEGMTVLALVLTLFFIAWQALLTRQAILSSEESSKCELRAYVVVSLNSGSYQERDKGIRFEGIPAIQNTGKTPAHNLRYITSSGVIKEPLGDKYTFPAPSSETIGEYVLGTSQVYQMHIIANDYVDPKDVPDIMDGKGKAFYYWGTVIYDDAFGESHRTEFCHRLYFYPNLEKPGTFQVGGNYIPGRNTAT
jgi:hypothetical protein